MPRGKKQKSPEEEQELLEDLYTNRNFSAPAAKALETITEADHSADDSSPTKALQPAAPDEEEGTTRTRKPRGAASRARASMAPKEVRRLDFVPYHVADKERDRRRVQRAAKVAKSKGKKPVKFQGLSGEQEDKLQRILYEKREDEEEVSEDEEETQVINRAIDKVLIRAATSAAESSRRATAEAAASTKTSSVKGPLQPNPTSSSATKRVNTKRRRSSASFKKQPQQPSFLEFSDFNGAEEELSTDPSVTKRASRSSSGTDNSLIRRSSSQSELPSLRLMESPSLTSSDRDPDPAVDRRASLELAIAVADAEFGPIDDGTSSGGRNKSATPGGTSGTPRQTPNNASSRPSLADVAKRTVNVRRSSRFFRQGASSYADGSVGSVFTQVEVAQKIDRRKSRRTHFVVFEQPEEPLDENSRTSEEGRKSSFSKGKPTETENLLQPESSIKDGGSFDNPQQHVRQPLSPIENFSS